MSVQVFDNYIPSVRLFLLRQYRSFCICKQQVISFQVTNMAEWSDSTKNHVSKLPLLATNAGPRDKTKWEGRLKEVSILDRGKQTVVVQPN